MSSIIDYVYSVCKYKAPYEECLVDIYNDMLTKTSIPNIVPEFNACYK